MKRKKFYLQDIIAERGGSSTSSSNDPIEQEINAEDRELAREARRLRLEELIQRRNNKLSELKNKGETKKAIAQVGNDYLGGIMDIAKVDPERAKKFLDSLTQDDIMKINLLASSGKNGGGNLASVLPLIKSDKTEIKDIVAIVKMMQPPPEKPTTISEVATLIKVMREMESPQADPLKLAMEYLKPMYDLMASKDQNFYKTQLENAQKQNVDPIQFLMQIKELAPNLGFVPAGGGNDQNNLEITKMKLDQEKWKMEQNWKMNKELAELTNEKQSKKDQWKMIEKIAVPALKQLQPVLNAAVNAGKQKLNTVATQPVSVPAKEAATAFLCPKCADDGVQTVIDVSHNPDVAVCKTCNAEFPKAKGLD